MTSNCIDDGNFVVLSAITINTLNTITYLRMVVSGTRVAGSLTGWTASGTKGPGQTNFHYLLGP
jgi:hypothetical protein